MRIDSCDFGRMVINGTPYTSDLIIYPDGRLEEHWRRRQGHHLSYDDMLELIDSSPELIIAGTGVSGLMKPDKALKKQLSKLAIELIAVQNQKAVVLFNDFFPIKRVGGCFHLTC